MTKILKTPEEEQNMSDLKVITNENPTLNTNEKPALIPLNAWNKHFEYPSVGALRQYNFLNTNGFRDKVIRLLGKRLYINTQAFFEWANSQKA